MPQVATLFELATQAHESNNLSECEAYCNRVLELDSGHFQAWALKGRVAGWQSSLDRIRINEAANCFSRAVSLVPESSSAFTRTLYSAELAEMCLTLIRVRKERFAQWPDDEETAGFSSDLISIMEAIRGYLSATGAIPNQLWESIASEIGAAVAGAWIQTVRPDYERDQYPSDEAFSRYVQRITNLLKVENLAISLSENDAEADIQRYEFVITLIRARLNAKGYVRRPEGYVVSLTLTPKARDANEYLITDAHENLTRVKASVKQAQEEQEAASRRRYWNQHPEEFRELDGQRAQLEEEFAGLKRTLQELPGIAEMQQLRELTTRLGVEMEKTGRLKFTERRALQDQIDDADRRLSAARRATDQQTGELDRRVLELEAQIRSVNRQLNDVPSKDEDPSLLDSLGEDGGARIFAEAADTALLYGGLMAGFMGVNEEPVASLSDLADGVTSPLTPTDREQILAAAGFLDRYVPSDSPDQTGGWMGPLLHLPLMTRLGYEGVVALGCRTLSDQRLVRVLVLVSREIDRVETEIDSWASTALWPLRKSEMYYLHYSDVVDEMASGPLSDPEALADPQILSTGGNPAALPGPGGRRLVCLQQNSAGSADLWVGWEVSERLAIPLFAVYLHRAVCALVDIPQVTPDWLDEVGGRAP